jgi:multidrug efflux pump
VVLVVVPLTTATGPPPESRVQIGWVIVGGMSLGTLLTIFVVPTMYMLFARGRVPGANKAEAQQEALPHHDELVAK